MAEYKEILYEKQRGGVLITLNRPEALNAITRPMLKEMHTRSTKRKPIPKSAPSSSPAPAALSAPGSIRRTPAVAAAISVALRNSTGMSAADLMNYWSADDVKLMRIFEISKPVIGAIRGWAMGGGCWLALYTHITIAAEDAVFAQPEVRHGSNTTFMWTLLAGFKNALRYGLVGDHIDAQGGAAHRLGQQSRAGRSTARGMFSDRRAHRPRAARDREDQSADSTMGLQMMGLRDALRMDETLSIPAHMMLQRRISPPSRRSARNAGDKSVSANARRPVSAGTVRTEVENASNVFVIVFVIGKTGVMAR